MDGDIQQLKQKIEEMDKKLDAILASSNATKRHARIIFWITIALVVLPAIGLVFVVPSFLSSYTTALNF